MVRVRRPPLQGGGRLGLSDINHQVARREILVTHLDIRRLVIETESPGALGGPHAVEGSLSPGPGIRGDAPGGPGRGERLGAAGRPLTWSRRDVGPGPPWTSL